MTPTQAQANDRQSAPRACAVSSEDCLSTKQAAIYLRSLGLPIEARTLVNYRLKSNARKGPVYRRFGRAAIWYKRGDLDEWFRANVEVVT